MEETQGDSLPYLGPGKTPPEHATPHPAYRADIDGLRALAVLPVVFYHAGVRGFSGGFVGVDIFFVISGYLITGILVRDVALNQHSIFEFYRRRILRIFPALMALLLVVTIGAIFLSLPSEIADYARSLGATALFVSNIGFYQGTDYFNLGAASQPLLHTWSLAVEEQWYILWPVILAAIGPRRPRLMLGTAIGITLVSFLCGLWLLPIDSAATFYLLPSRAWELGIGAVLAMIAFKPARGLLTEGLAVLGLILILASVKLYTPETAFPGLAALPPCLGAALLIHSGQSGTWVSRLLSIKPLLFIGWISYSLYLWHWPVIVFTETGLFLAPGFVTTTAMVLVSVALATLSWRYVERPFRTSARSWKTRTVLASGLAAIVATLLLAAATPALLRALGVFTPAQVAMANIVKFDGDGAYRRGTCFMVGPRSHYDPSCLATDGKRPAILVVGDSHAAQLWPGFAPYRDRFDVLQATVTGCVAKIFPKPWKGYCEAVIDGALQGWIAQHKPAALILASRWRANGLDGLEATLRDPIVRAAHPVLVGPIPQYSTALPRLLVFAERRHDPGLVARSLLEEPFEVDRTLRAMALRTGTPYVSLIDMLCTGHDCRALAAPNVPMQFDYGHLTAQGSSIVVAGLMRHIAADETAPGSAPTHERSF